MGVLREWQLNSRTCIKILIGSAILLWVTAGPIHAAGIEGTSHDLTTLSGSQNLCAPCHGSHITLNGQVPGWGRSDPKTVFKMYSSVTMHASALEPGISSLACLSCHDGVTAFDALMGSAGTARNNMNSVFAGSTAIIGIDLSDDHPIGVSIGRDPQGINAQSVITASGLKLYDGKVECSSCHDAHGRAGNAHFLRLDPQSGGLCLTCHKK